MTSETAAAGTQRLFSFGVGQTIEIAASFSNQAGQMTAAYTAGTNLTLLSFDMNGDSVADMAIEVVGNVTSADNFIL